jgi:hypothetical protein
MALTYAEKYKGNFHIVTFEDLAAAPEQTMRTLLGNLGLEFNEICVKPSFNSRVLEEVYPWGTIRTPTTEANVSTARRLSPETRLAILAECRVVAKHFGYDRFFANHLA